MLSCKDVAVLLSQDLDGELGSLQALKLRCHLLICRFCRRLRRQLLLQKRAAQKAGTEDIALPPDIAGQSLSETSRQCIKDLLQESKK